MEHQHSTIGNTPRATRFPLCLRARYRCEPDGDWHRATTVDVSHTGVLLRGREPIDVGRLVHIEFRLSHNPVAFRSSVISCQCRVVRIQRAPEDDHDVLIAVEIVTYGFHRHQNQEPSGSRSP